MPIVNAWGKLIQAPDDMSHEEIQSIILANEKDLNPDYKDPKSGAPEVLLRITFLDSAQKKNHR